MLFSLKSINEGRVLIKSRGFEKNRKISKRRGKFIWRLRLDFYFRVIMLLPLD